MQPHSMCAVALAGFMWNRPVKVPLTSVAMKVEYTYQGVYKYNHYTLSDITESTDQRELSVRIMRSSGDISCTVRLRRSSAQEGSEVTMTHDQNHVSGLREVYNLYKEKVANGMHYNSMKYRDFRGEFTDSSRKKLRLVCAVKQSDGSFRDVPYELEMM